MIKTLAFFVIASIPVFATIAPIYSISEIDMPEIEKKETLYVFDIDDTLTILREPAFQRPNFKIHHSDLFAQVMDSLSVKEKALAFTLPLLTTPGDLIESQSAQFIQQLLQSDVKIIGLTAAMGGDIGKISVENRRIEELQKVGIEFSNSFFDLPEILLPHFAPPTYGKPPVFRKGIIFTNENDKGKALVEFLKLLDFEPMHIVFVDDRLDHLNAVEKALVEHNSSIRYWGFHFRTDPACYQRIDADSFTQKWVEVTEQAKEILAEP